MKAYAKTRKTGKMNDSAKVCTICRLFFAPKITIKPLYIGTYRVIYPKNPTVKKVVNQHTNILKNVF